MRYHLTNQNKKSIMRQIKHTLIILASLLLLYNAQNALSQDLPELPTSHTLVHDLTNNLLMRQERIALAMKLMAFLDSTSTSIVVAIVPDLLGYAPGDYAQRLGEKWGVGQRGKDNGILIVVKPKTERSKGEVVIATGYGAEGAVPDLVCSDIVRNDILPAFRRGEYYEGLDKATNTIMSLIRGEFSVDEYKRANSQPVKKAAPFGGGIVFIIILVFIIIAAGKSNHNNISGKKGGNLPFWLLLAMMNSGRSSHRGSWGGFSGGGGGGGGFGGFGGGGFGGGGAGGSW
jgi:uncharacterized protein